MNFTEQKTPRNENKINFKAILVKAGTLRKQNLICTQFTMLGIETSYKSMR